MLYNECMFGAGRSYSYIHDTCLDVNVEWADAATVDDVTFKLR